MLAEKPVEHFSAIEDLRCAGKIAHRLIDILVTWLAVVGVARPMTSICDLAE